MIGPTEERGTRLIGRERELKRVLGVLDERAPRTRAVVLGGEAGIGKTTLWEAALAAAAERGHRVVTARPTPAEAGLPHAALTDLLGELADAVRGELPEPQAAALDVALMRAAPDGPPLQPLALGLAVLEVLRVAAGRQPLAIGIDDAPWLDAPSAAALRFALRRLDGEPVLVILSQRSGGQSPDPELLTDLPADRVTHVPVGPLTPGEVERVIEAGIGLRLSPSAARRAHRESGGNPFFALEIGRAMTIDGEGAAGPPAALPGERLATVPAAGRAVAAHVAATAHPSAELLAAALGTDVAAEGLRAARAAGILAPDGPVRFAHPLLATAAWEALPADQRRAIHRQLATVVDEPEERARHLALGAEGPDASVAEALDRAAVHAHARGAPDIAAELAELAATVTPAGDPMRATRMAGASRCWVMGGDIVRARDVVERALDAPEAASGQGRAALLLALAGITQLHGDFGTAAQLGNQALAEVGTDEALGIDIRLTLAGSAFITGRDWEAGARHAADALAIAERAGDERLLARTIGKAASWRYATGGGIDPQLEHRTVELEPWVRHLRTLDMPAFDLASMLVMDGQTARGHALVRQLVERAERDADASSLPFLLANAATADFLAGDVAAARARLDRADRMAEVTEQATARVHVLVARVRLEARLGGAEVAVDAAHEALRLMDATGWRVTEWRMRSDLAHMELSRDDPAAALAWVAGATDPTVDERAGDGSGRRFAALAMAAEALVALGRLDEAAAALDALDARLRTHPSPRDRGEALRARARLAAARGGVEEAGAAIAEAEAIHRGMEDDWEVARTLLVAAEIHRRGRRRARARDALREALRLFAGLGARRWAKVVQDGMGRIGTAHDGGPLTPTQRRVAELAAAGLTNRQIADRLSMSRHTAEAHLSAAYRALEIEGRTELAAALDGTGDRDSPADVRDSATS